MATTSLFKRKRETPDEEIVIEDDHPAADMSNYVFGENLGTGAYAKVLLAKIKSTGAKVLLQGLGFTATVSSGIFQLTERTLPFFSHLPRWR